MNQQVQEQILTHLSEINKLLTVQFPKGDNSASRVSNLKNVANTGSERNDKLNDKLDSIITRNTAADLQIALILQEIKNHAEVDQAYFKRNDEDHATYKTVFLSFVGAGFLILIGIIGYLYQTSQTASAALSAVQKIH